MIHTTVFRFGLGLTGIALLGMPMAAQATDTLPPLLEIVAGDADVTDPATAFNPRSLSFVVVWRQRADLPEIKPAVMGRLVTPRLPLRKGKVRLGEIFTISANGDEFVDEPSLAVSKRGNVLVTWEQDDGPFASLLDKRGATIKAPFPVDPDDQCGNPVSVNVAYNRDDDEWLVLCAGEVGLKGRLLDAGGDPLGDVFHILDRPSPTGRFIQVNPAYDRRNDEYLLVLLEQAGVPTSVVGWQLPADGGPVGPRIEIAVDADVNNTGLGNVAYDRLRNRFLVIWRHQDAPTSRFGRIEARFVDGGSGIPGDRFFISDGLRGEAASPTVVMRGFVRYLAIWDEDRPAGPFEQDIYGQSLRANGNPIRDNFALTDNPLVVNNGPGDVARNLACFGAMCLALWEQNPVGTSDQTDIAGRLLFRQP